MKLKEFYNNNKTLCVLGSLIVGGFTAAYVLSKVSGESLNFGGKGGGQNAGGQSGGGHWHGGGGNRTNYVVVGGYPYLYGYPYYSYPYDNPQTTCNNFVGQYQYWKGVYETASKTNAVPKGMTLAGIKENLINAANNCINNNCGNNSDFPIPI